MAISMESTAIFSVYPAASFLTSKPSKTEFTSLWKFRRSCNPTVLHCNKMFVPGFGEASPEAKAAGNLHNFFTFVAVKIVAAQLESYNPEGHKDLMEFVSKHSLDNGDKFCADMMRYSANHQALALRILEVRSAYCKNDFEWDNLRRLSGKMVDDANTKIMRDYVVETSHET